VKRLKLIVEQLETRECPSSLAIATSIRVHFQDPNNQPAYMVANFMEDPTLATPSFWAGQGAI
jgi:hypothetical protein